MTEERPLRRRSDFLRRLWRRFSHDAGARVAVSFVVLLIVAAAAVEVDHLTAGQALDRANRALTHTRAALTAATVALRKSEAAVTQAQQALQTTQIIQASRVAVCNDTNARHDATVKIFDQLIARAERHAHSSAARQTLSESRASTLLLLNAMFPYRNCAAATGS